MERYGVILLICLVLVACSCSQRTVAEVTSDDVINPPVARDAISTDDLEAMASATENSGTISGVVYLDKSPVSSYVVQLHQNKRFVKSETTDRDGRYSIPDLPDGEYTVWVLNFAYTPVPDYEGYVLIRDGSAEVLDVSIESS